MEDGGKIIIGGVLCDWNLFIICVFLGLVEVVEINEVKVMVIYKVIELI